MPNAYKGNEGAMWGLHQLINVCFPSGGSTGFSKYRLHRAPARYRYLDMDKKLNLH